LQKEIKHFSLKCKKGKQFERIIKHLFRTARTNYKCLKLSIMLLTCFIVVFSVFGLQEPDSMQVVFKPTRNFTESDYLPLKEKLNVAYGLHKILPEKYELQCLVALSFFPELKNVHIEFKLKDIKTTMACRPEIITVFDFVKSRSYEIVIDIHRHKDFGLLLENVPFNAQIGVIGHELAHVLDYETKNNLQLLGFGLNYLNNKAKEGIEKEIDRLTVSKGLGWQLYDWADFSMNNSDANLKYKSFKRRIYLNPENIINKIFNQERYVGTY